MTARVAASGRGEAHALWTGLSSEYDRYKESISYIPTDRIRLQEDLRSYLCLRCAGFLEQVAYVILDNYLEQKSGGPTLSFARSFFRHAPNLRSAAFIDLIGRFGDEHRASFEEFLSPVRRDALDDLLEVRNDIAHGKYHGGRKLDPARYVNVCEDTYDWLVKRFLGDSVELREESGSLTSYDRSPS